MMKNASSGAGGSSIHSSPENSMNYGSKFNQGPPGLMDSPHQRFLMEQARINEAMFFNDPRIVAGIRAMNLTPTQGEVRIPTPVCKFAGFA